MINQDYQNQTQNNETQDESKLHRDAEEQASEFIEEIEDSWQDSSVTERAKEKFSQYSEETVQYIQKHPIATVSIALGVGVLLGALLSR